MDPKIKATVGAGAVTFLLFISGLLVWLTPIPLLFLFHKNGRAAALSALGIAIAAVALVYFGVVPWVVTTWGKGASSSFLFWLPGTGNLNGSTWHPGFFGLSYLSFYGLIGLLLGFWENSERAVTQLVGKVLLVLAGALLVWVAVLSKGHLTSLFTDAEQYFSTMLTQMSEQIPMESTPELRDQLAALKTHGDTIVYYAVRLIPGMLIAISLFIIWLNVVVARKLFVKDAFFKRLGPLKNWQLPFEFVWLLIGLSALLIADIYLLNIKFFELLALNCYMVFALCYFLQGLAIVAFYGQKWSLPPLVRLIGYLIFLLFFQPIGILLLALGFFDSWFDFRRLTAKPKTT